MRWTGPILLQVLLSVAALGRSYPIRVYTTLDGLPRNAINRIVRDPNGYLWFCTEDGLSKFDGQTFVNYDERHGLPGHSVSDLLLTREGERLVATSGGVVEFLPDGGKARSRDSSQPRYFKDVLRVPLINRLIEDRAGRIWVATDDDGLIRLHKAYGRWLAEKIDLGMPPDVVALMGVVIEDIVEDGAGTIWVASHTGLYSVSPDGTRRRFAERDGIPGPEVIALAVDRKQRLWIGTENGLAYADLAELDPAQVQLKLWYRGRTHFPRDPGVPEAYVDNLVTAADGGLWVVTRAGIRHIAAGETQPGKFDWTITRQDGLPRNGGEGGAIDAAGNLWIATGAGAAKVNLGGAVRYTLADGISEERQLSSFFEDSANFCIARSGLLYCRDGDRFQEIRPRVPFKVRDWGWGTTQYTFIDHENSLWLPAGDHIFRYPAVGQLSSLAATAPETIIDMQAILPHREPRAHVFRLFEDHHGDVWISMGTNERISLYRWHRQTQTVEVMPEVTPRLPSAFAEAPNGDLWIGFYTGDLARWRNGKFQIFTSKDGLPERGIRTLLFDRAGRLWIPSNRGGLARVDDPAAEHPTFRRYTTNDGLSSNEVQYVTEDSYHQIWVLTGRGLDRLDPETGQIEKRSEVDGLPPPAPDYTGYRDSRGHLWFGSDEALYELTPTPPLEATPPDVRITKLKLGDQILPLSEFGERLLSGLLLQPSQRNLEVSFRSVGIFTDRHPHYRYLLEGTSKEWRAAPDAGTLMLAGLAAGSYRLLLQASSANGKTFSDPAEIRFRVLPPLWRRWWFLLACAVIATVLIWRLYIYRVNSLLKVERIRTSIAADLHDGIGSGLSQIALLSEVARIRLDGHDRQGSASLTRIAGLARELVNSMSDMVWAIHPDRDTSADLVQRVRRHASDLLTDCGIDLEFIAEDGHKPHHMGADLRRELLLIFKEALNNVVKHARCSLVEVQIEFSNGWLNASIRDDGDGFDSDSLAPGNGLGNMRRRAEKLGGGLSIHSNVGTGTVLRLEVPLTAKKITT